MFAWDALPSPSGFFGRPSAAGRRGDLRMTHLIFNHSICKSAIGRKKSTRDVQRLRRTFALIGVSPTRLKGWVYAGFAITLVSALIAYLAVGDGVEAWGWAAGTGVLWGVSYFFWRLLQTGASDI